MGSILIFILNHTLGLARTCNHKTLGIYYLASSLLFGISGTLLSMILRLELYSSGHRIISTENQNFYNLTFTLHGLLMIFFLVMPGLYGGFGNYFVPIFLGAPEVAFPRINTFSQGATLVFILLSMILGQRRIHDNVFFNILYLYLIYLCWQNRS